MDSTVQHASRLILLSATNMKSELRRIKQLLDVAEHTDVDPHDCTLHLQAHDNAAVEFRVTGVMSGRPPIAIGSGTISSFHPEYAEDAQMLMVLVFNDEGSDYKLNFFWHNSAEDNERLSGRDLFTNYLAL